MRFWPDQLAGAKIFLAKSELHERDHSLLRISLLLPVHVKQPQCALFNCLIARHCAKPNQALKHMTARHGEWQRFTRAERRKPGAHLFLEILDANSRKARLGLTRPTSRHAHRGVAPKML